VIPAAPVTSNGKIDDATLAALREVLLKAVSLRLVSDVPVGVFLSGGIDSSVLVGLLSLSAVTRVSTFSIVFKEADYSEAAFSQIIARRFNTDHHEIVLSQHDALEAIPDAISAMDQPTIDGINTYVVFARGASRWVEGGFVGSRWGRALCQAEAKPLHLRTVLKVSYPAKTRPT